MNNSLQILLKQHYLLIVFLTALTLWTTTGAHAAEEMRTFETAEQRELYMKLIEEFRCLKCQNQNLAGSAADLANDLKNEIQAMVLENKDADQITEFLVSRYGEFVRYKPAFKMTTLLLWVGPFILLVGSLFFITKLSRQSLKEEDETDPADLERARALLDD